MCSTSADYNRLFKLDFVFETDEKENKLTTAEPHRPQASVPIFPRTSERKTSQSAARARGREVLLRHSASPKIDALDRPSAAHRPENWHGCAYGL